MPRNGNRGKNAVFAFGLATMVIPFAVTVMLGSAHGTFLLRQFMLSLPTEPEDAARIDGCSSLGIYLRITLPLMKSALASLGVFAFMASWNEFLGPFIFPDRKHLFTVQLGTALARQRWPTG